MARYRHSHSHGSRRCDLCGRGYHRRNLIEVWESHGVGRVAGWVKRILRVCVACQSPKTSQRVLVVAQLTVHDRDDRRKHHG